MSRLSELIERQNRLWNRMQEIQDAAANEDRDWTAEERTNWDEAEKDLTTVSGDIERLQRAAKLEAVDYSQAVTATKDPSDGGEGEDREKRAEKYREAFWGYARRGMSRLNAEQQTMLEGNYIQVGESRAQGESTGSAGGYVVPQGFRDVMSETMKAYGGLLNHANVITTTTGNPLPWPSNDDTGNVGAILSENTQIGQQDLTLGQRILGAYTYTSKLVLVSLQLLQDSAFDLESWLPTKLGQRIGRAAATHFATGSGTGQPLGITTNTTVGKTGLTGQTLTLIYDDLIDLEHSVDPAYRNEQNSMYVLGDATLKVIRKLKDTQGRPLWVPVPAPGFPSQINGWNYVIDNSMPVPGANNKTIIFGDIDAGYIVRQVLDVQMVRLAERFMDALQIGFFGFARMDATTDDPAAVRAYQHSAS